MPDSTPSSSDLHLVPLDQHRTSVAPFDGHRARRAKRSYCARSFPASAMQTLVSGAVVPRAGDLALARVTTLRNHRRLELAGGRRASLYGGDEILVCYGNRYASDQFEAVVPKRLGPCHLVAAGGVAAEVVHRHAAVKPPTKIEVLGLIGDSEGSPLNLLGAALPEPPPVARRPFVLAVVGSGMNAGKTTTATKLVRGLRTADRRVGAVKVTGTGAGGDRWKLVDAGADTVLDFTDLGHVSTYRLDAPTVEELFSRSISHLAAAGVDVAVVEIADGLYQEETAHLLRSRSFRESVGAVIYAATDALGAVAGAELLFSLGLPLVAISGLVSRSPLAVRETLRHSGTPVLTGRELSSPEVIAPFVGENGEGAARAQAAI